MFTKGVKKRIYEQKVKEGLIERIPKKDVTITNATVYDDLEMVDEYEKQLKESHEIMEGLGMPVSDVEKSLLFPAPEGSANLYYGRIRQGKTYAATSDILDLLRQGQQVYANWEVKVSDFDDRENFFIVLMNILLFRKRFYKIPMHKNFHYINTSTGEVDGEQVFDPARGADLIRYLNTLNNCHLFIDEAWRIVDSYQGTYFSLESRDLVLVTGHKNRTINFIAQRPTSVHVVARGNMNRFYKCVKISSWPWNRFARYEFQDMDKETVDETKEPISVKTYFGSRKVYNAYNTHAFGGDSRIKPLEFDIFDLTFKEKCIALWRIFRKLWIKK